MDFITICWILSGIAFVFYLATLILSKVYKKKEEPQNELTFEEFFKKEKNRHDN